MDQKYQLPFKAGQTAEARCWEVGYRGAWFRCKIKKIRCREGELIAQLDYFDYPDENCIQVIVTSCDCRHKWTWTNLYQEPPYQSRESEETRQLMLRPEYPPVHFKNKVSNVCSNSEVTIVVDRTWKAGDLVDWWFDDCYWSGKVTKILCNGKAKIELMPPPLGEGATYEVFVKDLRPSLDWSPKFGWLVPKSQDSKSARQYPQLLKLISQGQVTDEGRRRDSQETTGSSSNSSFSIRLSGDIPPNKKRIMKTTEFVDSQKAAKRSNDMLNLTTSSAHDSAKSLPALDDKWVSKSKELLEQFSNIGELKEATTISKASIWFGSDSNAPIKDAASKRVGPTDMDLNYFHCPLKTFKTSDEIQLNSLESDTLDASILNLEELASGIRWLKEYMECERPPSDGVTPSWKFVKHHGTSTKK